MGLLVIISEPTGDMHGDGKFRFCIMWSENKITGKYSLNCVNYWYLPGVCYWITSYERI